jgi:hypothetical protein
MHGYKITSTIYKISNRDFYLLLQHTIQKKKSQKIIINKEKGRADSYIGPKMVVSMKKQKDKRLTN